MKYLTCLFGIYLVAGFGGQTSMANADVGFVDDFKIIADDWHVAQYDFDHPDFATDWRRSQVNAHKGLALTVTPDPKGHGRFLGGSLRREEPTGYGRYEATIKAARGSGLVTGFFLYTGPYYGTRHDEIDIEFLGKDPKSVYLSWFVDGKLKTKRIPLGFDTTLKPRAYAFEWLPDRLRWYVEGTLVFEHHKSKGPIPEIPGRLFANIWAASDRIASWAGSTTQTTKGDALIRSVAFYPHRSTEISN